MASSVKINELPSGNFNAKVFDFTDASGKRHYKSITASSKRDVKLKIAEFLAEREDKRCDVPGLTVGEAMERYIEAKSNVLSPSTVRSYDSMRRTRLTRIIDTPLGKLTQSEIQRAINDEAQGHTPKTVRNINAFLKASLKFAMPGYDYEVTLPQKVKADIRIPTEAEMQKIYKYVEGTRFEIPVYLAAMCGLRRSEILALRWKDIDFEHGTMAIKTAMVVDKEYNVVRKSTKSTSGKRIIRVFTPALEVLRKAYESSSAEEVVTGMEPHTITNKFPPIVVKCGITKFRFHDLRHYAVSVMLALNMPKKYIAAYVGHGSEKMIDDVYGHIMADKQDAFMDAVDMYYTAQMQHKMQHEFR